MPTYLLPCSCGKSLPVEPRQSGEVVACGCGATREVPPLTKLRALPQLDTAADTPGGGWSFRQGVLTAGTLLCLALVGGGAYTWAHEPPPPSEFDGGLRAEMVETRLEEWTPQTAFELWRWEYEPILRAGRLEEFVNPHQEAINQRITLYRVYRWAFFGLAAVVGAGSVALAVAFAPGE